MDIPPKDPPKEVMITLTVPRNVPTDIACLSLISQVLSVYENSHGLERSKQVAILEYISKVRKPE